MSNSCASVTSRSRSPTYRELLCVGAGCPLEPSRLGAAGGVATAAAIVLSRLREQPKRFFWCPKAFQLLDYLFLVVLPKEPFSI